MERPIYDDAHSFALMVVNQHHNRPDHKWPERQVDFNRHHRSATINWLIYTHSCFKVNGVVPVKSVGTHVLCPDLPKNEGSADMHC